LEREGSLDVRGEIPPDHPSWEGTELRFSTPLVVFGEALWVSSGGVFARLRVQGQMPQECRRCLDPVDVPVEETLELVFAPPDEGAEPGDDAVRLLPDDVAELDLSEAIREEMILSQSMLALCKTDCRGLCPSCGVNLNVEICQCSKEESDPRWDALRTLNEERE
jgi:uncharacterized protein